MTIRRRKLKFASLDDAAADVGRLDPAAPTVGRWSLAQICHHLELSIRLSMDGVPVYFPWAVRRIFGPAARRVMLWRHWIPTGVKVPDVYLPKTAGNADCEQAALLETISRFQKFAGPFDEHPLLGRMSSREWHRFHCIHCAHHLSFAWPRAADGDT